jgi:hypothetical protein
MNPLLAGVGAIALFPSLEHQQVSVGAYNHAVDDAPVPIGPDLNLLRLDGLELRYRGFEWIDGFDSALRSTSGRLRLYYDSRGVVQLDQLLLDSHAVSIRLRPQLGDQFDLALLGGNWETTWASGDTGRAQYRMFSPANLTLLGFSNTDQDDDDRLKHYFSIGTGAGADVITRVLGPLGFRMSSVGEARTLNRHRADALNYVRHETSLELEAGAGLLFENTAWTLDAWGEMTSQWETRDDDGKSGVDRQYMAWGLKLQGRFYTPDDRDLSDPLGALP